MGCGQDGHIGTELYDLPKDSLNIMPGGQGVNAIQVTIVPDDVQGVGADGAGRSEEGHAFHFKQMAAVDIIAWKGRRNSEIQLFKRLWPK
jgi:hypothetical protein